jgi:hypothetical protein
VLLAFDVRTEHPTASFPGVVVVTDYAFQVYRNGAEFLVFHWHPGSLSWMAEPHLHVKGSIAGVDLTKAHLPTGEVTLQAFIRFLIVDLGVEPVRTDWRTILQVPSSVPSP